jgi:hypothetical protein
VPTATPEPRKHPREHNESDDLELFLGMFLVAGAVAGIAAAHGPNNNSYAIDSSGKGPASWSPEPRHDHPRLPSAATHPADLDAAGSLRQDVGALLGAPRAERAYARWVTRESVVEWTAHEWDTELLLTSFTSRVLLGH